jgi:hypothetical protein
MAVKGPFHNEIEDLFASDKSIVLKLLGGAFVGAVLSLSVVLKRAKGNEASLGTTAKVITFVGATVIGAIVVLLLTLRDVVARRVDAGQQVNPILKAYFGRGNGCLMLFLWGCTIIVATLIFTMATVNM